MSFVILVLSLQLARERRRAKRLAHQRERICYWQMDHLQALARGRDRDLRARVETRLSDSVIQSACLGAEYPVSDWEASWCWIESGDERCYLEPAKKLYELYHQRFQ